MPDMSSIDLLDDITSLYYVKPQMPELGKWLTHENTSAFWRQTWRQKMMPDMASIVHWMRQQDAMSGIVFWRHVWRQKYDIFSWCNRVEISWKTPGNLLEFCLISWNFFKPKISWKSPGILKLLLYAKICSMKLEKYVERGFFKSTNYFSSAQNFFYDKILLVVIIYSPLYR